MPRQVFEYDLPERFVAGTTGQPGGRTFFLQVRASHRVTTVQLEKQQVSVLAERVDELLDEVLRRTAGSISVPALTPVDAEDTGPLDIPIEEEFRVGTMSLAWDSDLERVVIECFEAGENQGEDDEELPDADDDADGAVLRVSLAGAAARAFAKRALAVVSGRPPALSLLQQPAGPGGPRLPPRQRVPALNARTGAASLPDEAHLLTVLEQGELEVHGRLTEASNATLYCTATLDGETMGCVYKPVAGEKPLWDFPTHTLAMREVSAYVLSTRAGFGVVPPTVLRDGPFGAGSVQWWVTSTEGDDDARPGATGLGGMPLTAEPLMGELGAGVVDVVDPGRVPAGWMVVMEAEDRTGHPVVLAHADDPTLRRMALFDAVTNNTDRKGGHILRHASGAIYGVDHGLTFNLDDKLRTVLWGWAGDPLDEDGSGILEKLNGDLRGDTELREDLVDLLSAEEVDRTARRAAALLRRGRYPRPNGGWPAIPWPPF